jgi:TonB family protein
MNTTLLLGNVLAWSLQIGLLVTLFGCGLAALRLKVPRARLLLWQLLLAASLLLPMAQPWRHPLVAGSVQVVTAVVATVSNRVPKHSFSWNEIALFVLAAGILIHLTKLALGFWRLRRYRRRSQALPRSDAFVMWTRTMVRNADLRLSDEVSSPVTFGFFKPVILLPNAFPALDPPLQEAIVWHEVLHVQRRDWLFTIAEELVRAVFWFHPAIWWLLSEIQLAREQAVDQAVVDLTNAREHYVDALLAIAGTPPRLDLAPAPLFLRKRHLKQRVVSILEEIRTSRSRKISALAAGVTMLAASCWFVTGVFPLQGAPQIPHDAPGVTVETNGAKMLHRTAVNYPPEAIAKGIQGTVIVQAKLDAAGNVLDASVVSGPDELRKSALQSVLGWHFAQEGAGSTRLVSVSFELPKPADHSINVVAPAFGGGGGREVAGIVGGTPQPAVVSQAPRVVSGITIIGLSDEARDQLLAQLPIHPGDALTPELNHQVTQTAQAFDAHLRVAQAISAADQSVRILIAAGMAGQAESRAGALPPPPPSAIPAAPGRLRIGADVQQANLISQPKPVYPALAKMARVQGTVTLETLIGKDGHVEDIQLISGPPLLVQAAVEAVKQWVYKPTLLNGNPVEVTTTASVNFTLAE